MSAALDFTYEYAYPSVVGASPSGRPQLSLATCDANHAKPYFFDGRVRQPRVMGEMLYVLADVVRTHFFLPRPEILDPVLTSNERLLRLEGFSGCCGVYARVDLPAEAFEGECHGRGTTNVDFNAPMRSALLRLRDLRLRRSGCPAGSSHRGRRIAQRRAGDRIWRGSAGPCSTSR